MPLLVIKCRETVQCAAGVSDVRRIADLLLRNISVLKAGDIFCYSSQLYM